MYSWFHQESMTMVVMYSWFHQTGSQLTSFSTGWSRTPAPSTQIASIHAGVEKKDYKKVEKKDYHDASAPCCRRRRHLLPQCHQCHQVVWFLGFTFRFSLVGFISAVVVDWILCTSIWLAECWNIVSSERIRSLLKIFRFTSSFWWKKVRVKCTKYE